MLRLANGFDRDLNELRTKLDILREQCQVLGRSYEHIEKTTLFLAPLVRHGYLDPGALNYFRALGEFGIDEVMIRYPDDPATFDLLATELIPMMKKIPVAGR